MAHSTERNKPGQDSLKQDKPKQNNIYALLIGIDHYLPNNLYLDLHGCVRDIDLVSTYLQESLSVPTSNIYKLVAPIPNDNSLENVRAAKPMLHQQLPTYRNIVESFQSLTEKADAGDQVYIHYSGHGGRATTVYPDVKGQGQLDESIVPTDFCAPQGRYLRDVELAMLLKQMTDRKLIVTIVLDSCHSGGATRGDDCAIRGGERIDRQQQSADSLVASKAVLESNWQELTQGKAPASAWLPRSREYVCLAACRPSELANEYAANGKDRNGALTFWMIDTLTNNSVTNLDYRSLYERISTKIQSRFPQQLPMLIGEENRIVLGTDLANRHYTVLVQAVDLAAQQVTLKVGLAQGMSRGSRFAIYPPGTADFSQDQQRLAIVEVSRLQPTSCVAAIVPPAQGGLDMRSQLQRAGLKETALVGAPAVMESAPVDLKRRVRLVDDKPVGNSDTELPPELASQQKAALQPIRAALAHSGWVSAVDGQSDSTEKDSTEKDNSQKEAHYQVAINASGAYEICVGLPIENLRPHIMIGEPDAGEKVAKRLVHLTKYQSVQELENRVSRLATFLDVSLMQQPSWQPGDPYNPVPFDDPNDIEIAVGSYAFLRIANRSQAPLNIAVLDLEPNWAISKINILGLPGPFYEMSPGEEQITPLQFALPSGPDDQPLYQRVTETIKVFAALGPADFSSLELPPLDNPITAKRSVTRSSDSGALNRLISAISAESPTLTRAATRVSDPNQAWTTKQIRFTLTQ